MLQELDEVRHTADENHELFVKYSQESEKEHAAFIKAKNDLRDLEKAIYAIKIKQRLAKRRKRNLNFRKRPQSFMRSLRLESSLPQRIF